MKLEQVWTRDIIIERFPDPVTPLFWDIYFDEVSNSAAQKAVNLLGIKGFSPEYKAINGYVYNNYSSLTKISLTKLFFKAYKISVKEVKEYKNKITPINLKYLDEKDKLNLKNIPEKELFLLMDGAIEKFKEEMTYQSIISFISVMILKIFELKSWLLFGKRDLPAKLIANYENVLIEITEELCKLSELVRGYELLVYFKKYNGQDLINKLKRVNKGKEFLKKFEIIIDKYPYQAPKYDFINPTWKESPGMVMDIVKDFVFSGQTVEKEIENRKIEKEKTRNELLVNFDKSRSLIKKFSKNNFYKWLELADELAFLKQSRSIPRLRFFWLVKKICLTIGDKLVKGGEIRHKEDVFFLKIDELRRLVNKQDKPAEVLIEKRKKEFEKQFDLEPPERVFDLNMDFLIREELNDLSVLNGLGASSGIVKGRARVILETGDFNKISKGDILVAKTTNPIWTPLFSIISGIITEVGGMLSHPAIVSREMKIPAVVSVKNATRIIKDNDLVEIDGSKGIVRILRD